jgi:hypothetical protein
MTATNPRRRSPGSLLLTLARFLFDPAVVCTVVQPTIADLQREATDPGAPRSRRLLARLRGYRAFWTLVLVAPFALAGPRAARGDGIALPDLIERVAVTLIAATLLVFTWPILGVWTIVAAMGGTGAAVALRTWHNRHPTHIVVTDDGTGRRPEINLSSIHVKANAGGLIFVVGSVIVIMLGLPMLRWFLLVGVAGGFLLAWALLAWHTSHPTRGLPHNHIVLR